MRLLLIMVTSSGLVFQEASLLREEGYLSCTTDSFSLAAPLTSDSGTVEALQITSPRFPIKQAVPRAIPTDNMNIIHFRYMSLWVRDTDFLQSQALTNVFRFVQHYKGIALLRRCCAAYDDGTGECHARDRCSSRRSSPIESVQMSQSQCGISFGDG